MRIFLWRQARAESAFIQSSLPMRTRTGNYSSCLNFVIISLQLSSQKYYFPSQNVGLSDSSWFLLRRRRGNALSGSLSLSIFSENWMPGEFRINQQISSRNNSHKMSDKLDVRMRHAIDAWSCPTKVVQEWDQCTHIKNQFAYSWISKDDQSGHQLSMSPEWSWMSFPLISSIAEVHIMLFFSVYISNTCKHEHTNVTQ